MHCCRQDKRERGRLASSREKGSCWGTGYIDYELMPAGTSATSEALLSDSSQPGVSPLLNPTYIAMSADSFSRLSAILSSWAARRSASVSALLSTRLPSAASRARILAISHSLVILTQRQIHCHLRTEWIHPPRTQQSCPCLQTCDSRH